MEEINGYTLAIETAGQIPSVSILKNSTELDFAVCDLESSGSSNLIPMIGGLLKKNLININQFEYLAVSVGPGSFTGVKIGLATAKGINFGARLRCIGVNYLEAVAFSAEREGNVRSLLSGGRDEFFVQDFFFENGDQAAELTKPQLKSLGGILSAARSNDLFTIVTDNKTKLKLSENLFSDGILVHPENMARYVGLAGIKKIKNSVEIQDTLQPLFLRESEFKLSVHGR
jgi:tRNA threonylcarbamoyladenosine biosynthesis protein TsaB